VLHILIKTVALDTANVKIDAGHDAKKPHDEQLVVRGKIRETGGNEG
jgi:hypothetical protein